MDIFNLLFGDIGGFLSKISVGFVKITDSLIQYNNSLTDRLFETPALNAFFVFTLLVGSLLYVCGVGFSFANFTLDNKEEAGTQLTDTLKNIFIGLLALSAYTSIPILLLKFTNNICSMLTSDLANASLLSQLYPQLESGNFTWDDPDSSFSLGSVGVAIYGIIIFVCVCKVFFANIKRGGILVTLIFVCSFHMVSIPRGYTDAFWSWCKQVAGVCITAFMQNFLISLAFLIVCATKNAHLNTLILSAGVALSASEVPRILQQFGLDTSMKANISQAIFATSGVVSIARAFV